MDIAAVITEMCGRAPAGTWVRAPRDLDHLFQRIVITHSTAS
jgi:hypothetical protein